MAEGTGVSGGGLGFVRWVGFGEGVVGGGGRRGEEEVQAGCTG